MDDFGRMSEGLPLAENKLCASTKKKLLDEFRLSASSLAKMFTVSSETLDEAYSQGYKDCLNYIIQAQAKDTSFDIAVWAKNQRDRFEHDDIESDATKRRQREGESDASAGVQSHERCPRPNTGNEGKRTRTR